METKSNMSQLRRMLPDGEIKRMAERAGVTSATVSIALKRGRPGNRFVIEAMTIARESGALGTAKDLATLNAE
jgi:hypothetical protein